MKRNIKSLRRKVLSKALRSCIPPLKEDYYWESTYYNWLERIKSGEEDELKWLKKLPEEKLDDENGDFLYPDVVMEARGLSSTMYAAFLVSLWSDVEHFLKNSCKVCKNLSKCNKKNLDKKCWKFRELKKCLKKGIDFDSEKHSDYNMINAVRILNNEFKHNTGYYSGKEKKDYDKMNKDLCIKWNIKEDERVDYAKLPHKELIFACGRFCDDIAKKLISAIKSKEVLDAE